MKDFFISEDYLKLIGMRDKQYRQVELDCEICNRKDFELVLNKGRIGRPGQYGPISIKQCRHCGHVMFNPRYEAEFYVDYYMDKYKDIGNFGGEIPKGGFLERQAARGEAVRRYLAQKHKILSGSVLDLGCSYGAAMVPFRDNGWVINGIDPEKASVEYGRQKLSLPVIYGIAEKLPYENESFDLVVSLGTLEHVYDFHAVITELFRVIKNGGHIFVRMRNNRPWGLIWEYYNKNHNRFFSEATHKLAMIKYGFEVIDFTAQTIEGRPGDNYLLCRKSQQPSAERVEHHIRMGLRDSPAELTSYLASHHQKFLAGARQLVNFVQSCDGNLDKAQELIKKGVFKYTIYTMERLEAIERALFEAEIVLREGKEGLNYS